MKNASVEKDAGAEVLFWRVHVVDELLGSRRDLQRVSYNYIRLKIFDEKGKERSATIDLNSGDRSAILDIAGRTVKSDGSVVELDKKTVYRRDVVRASGMRRKVTSFAMPGVEPGAIVEYRWKEALDDNRLMYLRLKFQREFPVEKVTYFVKPLSGQYTSYEMYIMPFNCKTSPIKEESDGYASTSVENVPALREEPFAPSEAITGPWALLYYRQGNRDNPDKYWNDSGKKAYQELKDALKTNDELKTATAAATEGAKNEDEKVVGLIAYIHKNLRNLNDPSVTDAERTQIFASTPRERFRTAVEIFKSGIGRSYEMNVVFAAMALHAGLDARPAFVADRNEIVFNPKALLDTYFLDNIDMAVKLGSAWKIFDVSSKLLAPGMLSWREEGVFALVSDPKAPVFVQTPISPPDASVRSRVAHLELSVDGSIRGGVQESYSGHHAEDRRSEIFAKSSAEREEWVRDRVTRMFPNAEVTEIKLENVEDTIHPLQIRYHLEASNFAQVTGKRLLIQPIAFQRGEASPFAASERRHPVFFPYAWKETDQVSIKLPPGYAMDNAQPPPSLNFGTAGGYHLQTTFENGELTTVRELTFGGGGVLYFDAQNYGPVKKVFDEFHTRDRYTMALREAQ